MANNKIQIRRSTSNATVTGLSNGELAFTQASNTLWIGAPDGTSGSIRIGGQMVPGVLTANQALVANSTSGIDKIITANLTLGGASVSTINAVANLTNLGAATNSELTTTWAIKTFVDAKIAQASNPQGSNGQFQYNDSGVLNGTNNMVFDKTTGQITVGNSTVNVQIGYTGSINALAHFHGQQNSYVQVILQNSNTGTAASSDYVLENDAGSETNNFLDLGINSSNYNDANFSAMGAGDSYLYAANNDLVIGTADPTTGELRFITGGTTTSQIRATVTVGGNVGIGNTAPNARLQVTGTANISGLTTISANLVLGAGLTANGSGGGAGHVLKSGGAGANVYWEAPAAVVAGTDTQVQFNDGGTLAGDAGFTFVRGTDTLTVNGTITTGDTGTGTGGFLANDTVVWVGNNSVNTALTSSGLFVNGTATIANSSGVYTTGTVNAASFTAGAIGTGSGGTVQNTTTMFVGNNTVNAVLTSAGLNVNGATIANNTGFFTTGTVNAASHTVGANVVVNSTSIAYVGNTSTSPTVTLANTGSFTIGNSTTTQTTSIISIANSSGSANITPAGFFGNGVNLTTINATSITTGTLPDARLSAAVVNTSGNFTLSGNTTLAGTNTVVSSNLTVSGALFNATGTVNAASHTVGAVFVANSTTLNTNGAVINSTGGFYTGLVNATAFTTTGNANATNFFAGANLVVNSTNIAWTGNSSTSPSITLANTGVFTIGNSTTTQTAAVISVANSTGNVQITAGPVSINATGSVNAASFRVGSNFIANSTQITLSGTPLSVNGSVGSAGQVLASNGATGSPYWTSAATGTITGVTAGSGLTGGGASGSVTLDVGQGNGISVSADAIAVLGGSTLTVNSTGVHVNNTLSITDLTLSGNLTVLGDLVSLNVATISVEDSMITLAKDQSTTATFTDAVDIGFFGTYGNTSNAFISGIFRDQSDSGIWKVFASNGTFTNATIDTANTAAFRIGTLQSFLISGGLTTNSTSANLIANSTYTVGIVANAISLSGRANNDLLFSNGSGGVTGLALGISGYVLQSNGTAIVYDTLDGGTF